jgi:hypothetical protein
MFDEIDIAVSEQKANADAGEQRQKIGYDRQDMQPPEQERGADDELSVATGTRRARPAAEKLPLSTTARSIGMASKRSSGAFQF